MPLSGYLKRQSACINSLLYSVDRCAMTKGQHYGGANAFKHIAYWVYARVSLS